MWHSSYDRDECHEWVRGEFANLAREMESARLKERYAAVGLRRFVRRRLAAACLERADCACRRARRAREQSRSSRSTASSKTLTLEEAMAALNIPSVSLALIDQDRIAFARAYGAERHARDALSGGVAVEIRGRGRRHAARRCRSSSTSTTTSTRGSPRGRSRPTASTRTIPSPCAGLLSMTAGIGVPGLPRLRGRRAAAEPDADPLRRAAGQFAAGHGDCRAGQRLSLFRRGLRDRRGADGRHRAGARSPISWKSSC